MPQYQVYDRNNAAVGKPVADLDRAQAVAGVTARNVGEPAYVVEVGRNDWGLCFEETGPPIEVSSDEIPPGIQSKNKPMKIREIKSALLEKLLELYKEHGLRSGFDLTGLTQSIGAPEDTIEEILVEFRNDRIVDFQQYLGGMDGIRLTTAGVQELEDPDSELAPFIQHITVHGNVNGSIIGGTGNSLTNVNHTQVLNALADRIDAAKNVPEEKKRTLSTVIRDLAKDAGAAAAIAKVIKDFADLFR